MFTRTTHRGPQPFSHGHRRPRRLSMEPLEQRRLLSVDSFLDAGVLTVHGTDQPDEIVAFVEGVDLHVKVNEVDIIVTNELVDQINIFGEAGDDTITIKDSVGQTTMLDGGTGNDKIQGSKQDDSIHGGWGSDDLHGGAGNDLIIGDPADVIPVSVAAELDAERDGDAVVQPEVPEVVSAWGRDRIHGDSGNDSILGMLGSDVIDAGTGDDRVSGGSGNDYIQGGWGSDRLYGGTGDDTIVGDPADIIAVPVPMPRPMPQPAALHAAAKVGASMISVRDVMVEPLDPDILPLRANDTIYGGSGKDRLLGMLGNDVIIGDDVRNADVPIGEQLEILGDTPDTSSRYNFFEAWPSNAEGGKESQDTGSQAQNALLAVVHAELGKRTRSQEDNDTGQGIPQRPRDRDSQEEDATTFFEAWPSNADAGSEPVASRYFFFEAWPSAMEGGPSNDDILAALAKPVVHVVSYNDRISGGSGNDRLDGNRGRDVVSGGLGGDYIQGGWGDDTLMGNEGNDTIVGDPADIVAVPVPMPVDAVVDVDADAVTVEDVVIDPLDPTICPPGGNDRIVGGAGHDRVLGMLGNDKIDGGDDADRLRGGSGKDSIYGGGGGDQLRGDAGNDSLHGGAGDDQLDGDAGNDRLYGDPGDDDLVGGLGADRLYGGSGDDDLSGGDGRDYLYGQLGNDQLRGGADNDRLFGNGGFDALYGEDGNDFLHGGRGTDYFDGGAGRDLIWAIDGMVDYIKRDDQDIVFKDPWDVEVGGLPSTPSELSR